jgi:hypothetical protein
MACDKKTGEEALTWLYHLHHDNRIPYEVRALASILPSYAPTPGQKEDPYIYVSQETLMLMTGKSRMTIHRHLAWLVDNGWLIRLSTGSNSGRAAKASTYLLHTPEHVKVTRENPEPRACDYRCKLKEHVSLVVPVQRTCITGEQEHVSLVSRTCITSDTLYREEEPEKRDREMMRTSPDGSVRRDQESKNPDLAYAPALAKSPVGASEFADDASHRLALTPIPPDLATDSPVPKSRVPNRGGVAPTPPDMRWWHNTSGMFEPMRKRQIPQKPYAAGYKWVQVTDRREIDRLERTHRKIVA